MTDKKQALTDLLAKIEAGKIITASDDCLDLNWDNRAHFLRAVNNGSLDAAKALHEAVLPDAWVLLRVNGKYAHCTVDVDGEEVEANNQPDPARAWLIAIIKALIAEETQ